MALINKVTKEICLKVVYCGHGLSGKTTNVEYIYKTLTKHSPLFSVKTETGRTKFCDFLPIKMGVVKGWQIKVHLYSVPGQVCYDASSRIVLRGSDGIVFVVDSQKERLDANIESLDNLKKNMLMNSQVFNSVPMVIQYNKTDLPDTMQIEDLRQVFNPENEYTEFAASAVTGKNVIETFRSIIRAVMINVKV